MHTSKPRVLSLFVFAAIALPASAQFDNQWATFVQDNSRLKNPNGTPATHITGDTQEKDMFVGDLNKDGWLDLVIVRKQPATSTGAFPNYLLMNENGQLVDRSAQYASASDVPGDMGFLTATNDRDVVFVDVNNDTWLDVVTCTTRSNGLPKHISHPRVYMNLGSSGGNWLGLRFENNRIPTFPISPNFCGVDAGDVTGDGFADLYFTDYGQSGVGDLFDRLLINDGAGNFTDSVFTRLTSVMLDVRFGSAVDIIDMNMDGLKDIVRASGVTGSSGAGSLISVAYNDPANIGFFLSGNYQSQVGSSATYHVDSGDLNNDNRPDIIMSDDGADGYRYNLGTDAIGRVIWGGLRTYSYVTGTGDAFAGTNHIVDLNGDGWKDSIHCDFDVDVAGCTRRCHIFHNQGGTPGTEVQLKEEAGSAGNPWLGAVGFLAGDLTGTFDVATFDIDNDGDTDIVSGRCSGTFVWMNQKFQSTTVTGFCFGDGSSAACPCGPGAAGNGCPSSVSPTGGKLSGSGLARISTDTLVLTDTLVPNGPGLYYQGSGQTDIPFGDGKLCGGVGIIRLGVVFAAASTSSYPGGLTPAPIHIAGVTNAGDVRHYQTWYRDSAAAFCTPALFNLTNAVTLSWAP